MMNISNHEFTQEGIKSAPVATANFAANLAGIAGSKTCMVPMEQNQKLTTGEYGAASAKVQMILYMKI